MESRLMDGRRIYLMRHGETLYQRVANEGALGNGALTERGQEQVASVALLFRGVALDAIYASPLERAYETAQIIATEKELDIQVAPELSEIIPSETTLAQKSLTDIFQEIQAFFKNTDSDWDESYLGGESFRQVYARAGRLLQTLLAKDDWQTVLLVAHGGVNNAFLAHATGITQGRIFNIEQDFGCINIIDFVHARPFLRLANFTLYDQLKIHLREHSLDIILNLLRGRGIIDAD